MTLRDTRFVAAFRLSMVVAGVVGAVCTATALATVVGLLPYFTIQSNLAYALFICWLLLATRGGARPDLAAIKGALTLYVVITGLVFHLVLTNSASGFSIGTVHRSLIGAVGNQLLHTVVPILAVLDWLLFETRGRFRWSDAVRWLSFPFGYLVFVLVRGLIVHRYPYPFMDVSRLGYGGVAISAVIFGVGIWVLGLLFVLVDRAFASPRWQLSTGADPDPGQPRPLPS